MLPKIHLSIERWKKNTEYNVYVSTLGNIMDSEKKKLKIYIDHDGYCQVFISHDKHKRVHRLVMETWKPNDNINLTVDHINHNKRDNSLKNLEWVSKEENQKRAGADRIRATDCSPSSCKELFSTFNNKNKTLLFSQGRKKVVCSTSQEIANCLVDFYKIRTITKAAKILKGMTNIVNETNPSGTKGFKMHGENKLIISLVNKK